MMVRVDGCWMEEKDQSIKDVLVGTTGGVLKGFKKFFMVQSHHDGETVEHFFNKTQLGDFIKKLKKIHKNMEDSTDSPQNCKEVEDYLAENSGY